MSLKQNVKDILVNEYPHKEVRLTKQGTGDLYIQTENKTTLTIKTRPNTFITGDVIILLENRLDKLEFNEEKSEGKNGDAVFDIN
jgi:hypothetical protein